MAPTAGRSHGPDAHGSHVAAAVAGSQQPDSGRTPRRVDQIVGHATAVVIPILEWGAMGYTSWVFVYLVGVQYLINPSIDLQQTSDVLPRRHTGIAVIVAYAILLLLLLLPWLRLLQVIWMKIDLVPLGDFSKAKEDISTKKFDRYDAYICDYQGMPIWCDKCHNWKPDRTHHCKELNRCVRKMDHFCPWAGGIIGESAHKFFLQFVTFTAIYCLFTLIVLAIFLAEHIKKVHSRPPGTWIGALAVSAWFFFFTCTMALKTGWDIMINFTTVEGIQKGGVQNIAFLISRTPKEAVSPPSTGNMSKEERYNSDSNEPWPVICTIQRSPRRSYVVMQTKYTEHPWYTTLMMGWKDTMGNNFFDWILPIRQSPYKKRTRRGEFEWGEVVFDMARQYEKDNPTVCLAILDGIR